MINIVTDFVFPTQRLSKYTVHQKIYNETQEL
jgi:hypothetical protein